MDIVADEQLQGQRYSRKKGYAALLGLLVLCILITRGLIWHRILFSPPDNPFFYPLLLLTQSTPAKYILRAWIAILFATLLIFAAKQQVIVPTVFVFRVGAGVLLLDLRFGAMMSDLKSHNALWHQGQIYRLMSQWDEGLIEPMLDTERYIVLLCDNSGLICDQYGTPYNLQLEGYGPNIFKIFNPSGVLYIDRADQSLKLRIDSEIYPVEVDRRRRNLSASKK